MDELLAKRILNHIRQNPACDLDEIIESIHLNYPLLNAEESQAVTIEKTVEQLINQAIAYTWKGRYYTAKDYIDLVRTETSKRPRGRERTPHIIKQLSAEDFTGMEWMGEAYCKGMGAKMFIETQRRKDEQKICQEVCGRCPVREFCLDFGVGSGESGVWGGRILFRGKII
jgi:hypothetical protein